MSSRTAIRLAGVSRVFPSGGTVVTALDAVTLEIPCGAVTVLTGPSGSGKTTLLSLVGGLLPPSSGRIEVDGVDLSTLDQGALTAFRLRRIGFVFQAFHLIEALSVAENVELPLSLAGVLRPGSRTRADALVAGVGLTSRAAFTPPALSGGERQLCALARALANEPAVILADEPTGNLDADAGARVIGLLRAEAHEHGRALVVASHDPRVAEVADRIVRLEFGRVGTAIRHP